VRYDVSHALHLTYSRPVWEHHVEVRLTPQHNAHQHVLASELTVDPNCEARSYLDGFGNQVHYFSLIKPHDHLTVQVNAQVDTLLGNPFDFTAVAPAREREWLSHTLRAQPRLWDYLLHRSAATPDFARLSVPDLTLPTYDPNVRLLDSIMAALEWIGAAIELTPGFTDNPGKLDDVLTRRSGGCQDLAHLLIGLVRTWGFAARYVCGYQDPSYDEEAEDQHPHAWAEVLIPGAGWRGFDPCTQLVANDTYIAVAVGRDATDAVPMKAVFKGGEAAESAEATTDVVLEVTRDQ
jgi:transglutaminase-like putative cysteine protease